MAEESFARRDLSRTMEHLEAALESRYVLTTVILAAHMLSSAGLHTEAQEVLHDARERMPTHPIRRRVWSQEINAANVLLKSTTSTDIDRRHD
jgi:hypothetical protein